MKKFLMKHRFGILLMVYVAVCLIFSIDMASMGLAGIAFAGVTTTDLTSGRKGIPAKRTNRNVPIRARITIPLALQIASDIVQVVNVKAGWFVKQVQLIMVTASTGSALTVNVGDGGTAAGYDAAVDLKGAAGTETHGAPGTDAFLTAGGKYYTADDTIDFAFATVTSAAGVVVVDVIVHLADVNI